MYKRKRFRLSANSILLIATSIVLIIASLEKRYYYLYIILILLITNIFWFFYSSLKKYEKDQREIEKVPSINDLLPPEINTKPINDLPNPINYTASPFKESINQKERYLAMLCHLSCLFPFFGIIFSFLIWRSKGKKSRLIDYHGSEAMNFSITSSLIAAFFIVLIYAFNLLYFIFKFLQDLYRAHNIVYFVPGNIMSLATIIIMIITILYFFLIILYAAYNAHQGKFNKYPFNMRIFY